MIDARTDIIAMIDNAIGDHTISSDAMRWTPEPPKTPDLVDLQRLADTMAAARRQYVENLGRVFAEIARAFKPALENIARAYRTLAPLITELDAAKRRRIATMHADYRRKSRGRW